MCRRKPSNFTKAQNDRTAKSTASGTREPAARAPMRFSCRALRGTKMPAVTYTQRPFEATQTPAYRFALASGEFNIAVYLGQMSGGLCALDFDRDEDLAAFLAVNPALATTTRSRGSRGGMVWLRVTGEFPASCTTKHFEWRANGRLSTIFGRHPKGHGLHACSWRPRRWRWRSPNCNGRTAGICPGSVPPVATRRKRWRGNTASRFTRTRTAR